MMILLLRFHPKILTATQYISALYRPHFHPTPPHDRGTPASAHMSYNPQVRFPQSRSRADYLRGGRSSASQPQSSIELQRVMWDRVLVLNPCGGRAQTEGRTPQRYGIPFTSLEYPLTPLSISRNLLLLFPLPLPLRMKPVTPCTPNCVSTSSNDRLRSFATGWQLRRV